MAIELSDGGHVTFQAPILGDMTTFTFEMWIKLQWPPVVGAPQPSRNLIYVESYVEGGTFNGAQRNFTFITQDDSGTPGDELGLTTLTSWPPGGNATPHAGPLVEGTWQHLAYVRDDSMLRIYVNGTLQAEGPALTYTGPTPTEFHLGLFVNPVSGNEWGRFVVDEVRVSSVARYSIDFTPQMVFEPDLDTLSLWHFDEASGSTTVDASAGEPDATLSPTAMRVLSDR